MQTTQTQPQRTGEEARLEKVLARLETIEDQADLWMLGQESGTENNLNPRTQLDQAKAYFARIKAELKEAYKLCPAYAGGAE